MKQVQVYSDQAHELHFYIMGNHSISVPFSYLYEGDFDFELESDTKKDLDFANAKIDKAIKQLSLYENLPGLVKLAEMLGRKRSLDDRYYESI